MASAGFSCDYAARGTAACSKCKDKLPKGSLRMAKLAPSPYHEGDTMKTYFHAKCLFDSFQKARATTKVIDCSSDIEGFSLLESDDKEVIKKLIDDICEFREQKFGSKLVNQSSKQSVITPKATNGISSPAVQQETPTSSSASPVLNFDDMTSNVSFVSFCRLTEKIANDSSYSGKTSAIKHFLGRLEDVSVKEITLLLKLLLPGVIKRVYNLHNKQLLKVFSAILKSSHDHMSDHLDNSGDISLTVEHYFLKATSAIQPIPDDSASLMLVDVEKFLDKLSDVTLEKEHERLFAQITPKCSASELRVLIRLVKHDLRMNAGAKPVLDALDSRAYEAFQTSRDLSDVVKRVMERQSSPKMTKQLSIKVSLMTPVLPMLAEACKSVGFALERCPNGMYSEIKYDGERVQVHKQGSNFQYFSRSLKPVVAHKVAHIKEYLPKACPGGNDMIIDSEVLLVDTKTGQPLPFGTLGVHKKTAFANASVCLFIFDCLLFNEETLVEQPLHYRKKILQENITEIPNRIMLSEHTIIRDADKLNNMIMETIKAGLEGLVLKDTQSIYEPGKRHWLKVKKDYLQDGAMADTADLVCLGAYYGTGSKGGLMSSFLMCVYDETSKSWLTVTKVSNGFTDAQLSQINKNLKMNKISKDPNQVPHWIKVKKQLVPDFIATDVNSAPVWEITGAEFSQAEGHTADGISIRFPRVTKVRDDKSWHEATDFERLKVLVAKSKENSDIESIMSRNSSNNPGTSSSSSKRAIDRPSTGKATFLSPEQSKTEIDHSPAKRQKQTQLTVTPKKNELSSTMNVVGLKNIFTNLNLYVETAHNSKEQLERYFIAFDGELAENYEVNAKTIVVCSDNDWNNLNTGVRVSEEWIFDCIKAGKILSKDKYFV